MRKIIQIFIKLCCHLHIYSKQYLFWVLVCPFNHLINKFSVNFFYFIFFFLTIDSANLTKNLKQSKYIRKYYLFIFKSRELYMIDFRFISLLLVHMSVICVSNNSYFGFLIFFFDR